MVCILSILFEQLFYEYKKVTLRSVPQIEHKALNMPRTLWGKFTAVDDMDSVDQIVFVSAKESKLEEVQSKTPVAPDSIITLKVKNPLVTQTIEVMKQTEMLQSLIDTYSNKSGSSNYLLNPCQMIPEVDFPLENAADFVCGVQSTKPFWFVSPSNTRFSRGIRHKYSYINTEICRASLRKAVCGQSRVAGFTDIAESALTLFSDAIEEFMRNFIKQMKDVQSSKHPQNNLDITTLEKAYFSLTSVSLTDIHNYLKHNLIARNRNEISEFNGVLQVYDKLMKESRNVQKEELQEGDFFNILEMSSNGASNATTNHMTNMESNRNSNAVIEAQLHRTSEAHKKTRHKQDIEPLRDISDQQTTE